MLQLKLQRSRRWGVYVLLLLLLLLPGPSSSSSSSCLLANQRGQP